ncbi:hypothetical protein ACFSR7_06165 [Cohnella sp. GCM10020058]|uniref:hypothetical protein n=1 Tax=Cohnella sp. GCM10020058 TaxID=3317330 RepID=UPI00362FCDCE
MNGYLDVDRHDLLEALTDIKGIEQLHPFNAREPQSQAISSEDFLLVSIERADINMLIHLRQLYPPTKIVYLISDYSDAEEVAVVQSVCKAHSIVVIEPKRSPIQIARVIENLYIGAKSEKKRIIAGIGASYGTGLSSSLFVLGKLMAERKNIRVGMFGLNGVNAGTSFIPYIGKYLDEVWGALDGRQLQSADLLGRMDEIAPNFFYLAGNRDLLKTYYYTPEGIQYLIDLAQQNFDLVMLDLGAFLDTPLAVQGLLSSDIILVNTNQRDGSKDNWRRQKEQILKREMGIPMEKPNNIWLVTNQMYNSPDVETHIQLAKEYDLIPMASLPYINSFYRYEIQKDLLQLADKKYLQEIGKICEAFSDYYNYPPRPEHDASKGWFKRGKRH